MLGLEHEVSKHRNRHKKAMGQVLSEEFLLDYVLICLLFVVANMLEHSMQ